jgi:hypothetical protein
MWGMLPPEPPPYWSVDRDRVLRYTTIKAHLWAQAVGIACAKQASLSFELEAEESPTLVKRAQQMMISLDGTSYTLGVMRGVRDYLTTDNGEFWEIVRASNAAGSRVLGLMHLDSLRCIRTGDDEIPLVYRDLRGRYHELYQHEVIMMADMPSASAELFGVGLCATSRAYGKIVFMDSINTYFNEKITGRKANEIHLVNNVSEKTLRTGLASAEAQSVQEGYMVYKNVVVIPVYSENAVTGYKIEVAGVPDGFDHKTERDIANLEFANALGLDLQDLQPLSGQGLGTGAQSHVQAEKSKSKTLSARMKQFVHGLNQKFLPDTVTFAFSEIDLSDEEKRANIAKTRAETRAVEVQSGEITPVEARALAVEANDLPEEMKPALPNSIGDTLHDEEQPEAVDMQEQSVMLDEIRNTRDQVVKALAAHQSPQPPVSFSIMPGASVIENKPQPPTIEVKPTFVAPDIKIPEVKIPPLDLSPLARMIQQTVKESNSEQAIVEALAAIVKRLEEVTSTAPVVNITMPKPSGERKRVVRDRNGDMVEVVSEFEYED